MASKDLIFTVLGIDRASSTFDKVGDSMDKMATRGAKGLAGLMGAAAASSVAVGAATAAAPLLFVAIGAAAVAQTEIVSDAFSSLGNEMRSGLAQDAGPMAAALVGAAEDIAVAYQDLRPEMARAFSDAVPHVKTLTGGVIAFARNAMPGMTVAVERAGPAMEGLASLLGDTGTAVSGFFDEVSKGSEMGGQGLTHMGTLAKEVLPATGTLMVTLGSLWANHGDQAARIVGSLVDRLVDLGGNAVPIASSSIGVALDILEGLLAVIQPISGVLGPMIALWLGFSAAMKGVHAVKGIVDGIGDSVGTMREKLAAAGGAGGAGKFATGVGSVMASLGGPWGIAIGIAGFALAAFGQESQEAAQDQRTLTSALRESAGAFDANAKQAIIGTDQYKEISGSVKAAGITHHELVNALTQGGSALDALRGKLDATVQSEYKMDASSGTMVESTTDKGRAAATLSHELGGLREMVEGSVSAFELERDALGESSSAMTAALPGAASLREAIRTLGKDTADTADKVNALETAWRRMFGTALNMEEANAGFEASLDKLASTIGNAQKETANWHAELFTANGQVNITTERGRELQSTLLEQGRTYREVAQTAHDTTLQQTGSQEAATKAVIEATSERRRAFVDEWTQMLGNSQQAQELADRYLGVPGDVRTLITDPGAAEAIARAIQLRDKVLAVPDHKQVFTQAEVGSSIQALRDLGMVVETLPDGKIRVTAPNVDGVAGQIDYAARDRASVITVKANYGGAAYSGQGYAPGFATGGFYEKYAGGGMRRLTPMLGNSAAIVAPNSQRVIGDNPMFREAYIPINNSMASQAYLAQTADEMGFDLVRRGATAGARGGSGAWPSSGSGRGDRYYQLTIVDAGNGRVDLVEQFRRLEQLEMSEG